MEELIRKAILDVSLPEAWKDKWYQLLDEDESKESVLVRHNTEKVAFDLKTIDEKLNKLLNGYLDSVIDSETYKEKKNELFEEKLKLEEDLVNLKTNGSSPLEPFREWSENAFLASKIARAKNTNEDLAIFAKQISSNFFLEDRRLLVSYKKGFDTVFSELSPIRPAPALPPEGFLVTHERIELSLAE